MTPFKRITGQVQEKHTIYGRDAMNLAELSKCNDPRVIDYCKTLQAHKEECAICTWPRLYPFIRRLVQKSKVIFMRRIF